MSLLTPEQGREFDRFYALQEAEMKRRRERPLGHSGAGRPIERITYHEDVNGRQCCDVYFVGDTGFACMSHNAATLAGLAHEIAMNYGVNPEDITNKRLS